MIFFTEAEHLKGNFPDEKIPIPQRTETTGSLIESAQKALNSRQFSKALEISNQGIQNDSTAAGLLNIQATAYASQGRYALAIESLKNITKLDPKSVIAYLNLGGIHTKLGNFKQAEIYLIKALKLSPDQPEIHRRLGEVFLGTKRYRLAQEHFSTALDLIPTSSTLHYYLGRSLEGAGKNDSALATYLRAVKIDIGFAECNYRTALLAQKLGKSDIATENMQRYKMLGGIGSGNTESIKKFKKLRASILNAPESYVNHLNMGNFFVDHDLFEEAENQFQLAISLTSETHHILNQIGHIYLERKNPKSALSYYLRSAEMSPDHIPSILNIGVTYELIGDFTSALKYYESAIDKAPNDARCWYALGLANFNRGDIKRAKSAWEKTIQLTPTNHPLREEVRNRISSFSD